jgi:hypothetical protein
MPKKAGSNRRCDASTPTCARPTTAKPAVRNPPGFLRLLGSVTCGAGPICRRWAAYYRPHLTAGSAASFIPPSWSSVSVMIAQPGDAMKQPVQRHRLSARPPRGALAPGPAVQTAERRRGAARPGARRPAPAGPAIALPIPTLAPVTSAAFPFIWRSMRIPVG